MIPDILSAVIHIDNNFQFRLAENCWKVGNIQERLFMKKINFEVAITFINCYCPENVQKHLIVRGYESMLQHVIISLEKIRNTENGDLLTA